MHSFVHSALLVCLLLAVSLTSLARSFDNDPPSPVRISRMQQPPALTDFLAMEPNDEIAGQMTKVTEFIQQRPRDGQPATQRTEAYLGYDDKNLYIVFIAFDNEPDKVRARLDRRENAFGDDFVEVTLDTYHDRRRGYMFWSNPLGIQAEGIWTEEQGEPDWSFDTIWKTQGQRTKQGYVVLMGIPFKSLRFRPQDEQLWSITLLRVIPRSNEWVYWPHISARKEGRLSQARDINGLHRIAPGRSIQLIPYGSFRSFRALDQTTEPNRPHFIEDNQLDGGLDAKFVLKDNFVLDVTVNPDFSQIESDQPQITTNQRFEVFFPERRPFFLENSDFFNTPLDLVFTRRIADPQFGARLTGKAGPYAIGALIIDDQAPGRQVAANNPYQDKRALFTIARVRRDILKQSNIGVIYTGREFQDSYNRVGGIDGRLKLNQNWVMGYQAVASKTRTLDGQELAGPAYQAYIYRSGRQFSYQANYEDYSPNFRTAVGFVRRTDVRSLNQNISYSFRPEGKFLISWGPSVFSNHLWDHDGLRVDGTVGARLNIELIGSTFIGFFNGSNRERLRPKDYAVLKQNLDFGSNFKSVSVQSSYFKNFSINAEYSRWAGINFVPPNAQAPFLGNRSTAELGMTLRPTNKLRIDNTYLMSRLLNRYNGDAIFNNHIVRSKWNWQFDPKLSLRLIFQYDTLLVNRKYTALETRKNFNADLLMTYQLNPLTALYAGYNSNLQNVDLLPTATGAELARFPNRFINDGKQLFVKFSYLFRL
jgi:hypothetical protein